MTLSQVLVLCVIFLPLLAVILKQLRMDIAALIIAILLGVLQYTGYGVLGPKSEPAALFHTILLYIFTTASFP